MDIDYDKLAQTAFDDFDDRYTLDTCIQAVAEGYYSSPPEDVYASSRARAAADLASFDVPSSVVGAWDAIYKRAYPLGVAEARRQRDARYASRQVTA